MREAAERAFAYVEDGRSAHWRLDLDRLPAAADLVAAVTRERYPALDVPFHARWRHFSAGGKDRWASLAARFADPAARARAAFDLAIVSVLLDAGAGMGWRYREADGTFLSKSEGLAVASLDMFAGGLFSADPRDPLRADAGRLADLPVVGLADGFQAGCANPLVGMAGRRALMNALGRRAAARPDLFATAGAPRPGGLFDALAGKAKGGAVEARDILVLLLDALGPIWPGRESEGGVSLGDCWRHPDLGLVPFHKLSQWLSYSLIEPLEAAGFRVTGVDALTGLPEYRNGGLFFDIGVIALRDPADSGRSHEVGSALVVEWRALTVALLDRIAPLVRERLGVPPAAFPLAKVLEGGTWAAGRRLARERRADGGPPLHIVSDGTVF